MNARGEARPPRKLPPAIDNDTLPVMGLAANDGAAIPKSRVFAWALWDWATQPFATVITTFVFSVYLTSELFLPDEIRALGSGAEYDLALSVLSRDFGFAVAIAGIAVAILAPVLGQRADRSGRRKRLLAINTVLLVAVQASLFFATIEPNMFIFGITMVAIGNIFSEIANVNYNALITQVATPRTVGRVSGLGWGFGYLGGISMLLVSYFGFIQFDVFGLGSDNGIDIRAIAVACAAWTVIFAIPILISVPEVHSAEGLPKTGFFASYRVLFQDIAHLYRTARTTFWFLLASAIFRDGLAGVFTFGGVLAAITFGFSATEVLIFGIVANLVAGISTMAAGKLDDWFGPRSVIIGSLTLLLASGLALFFLRDAGALAFWIGGLVLGASVGPAQAAGRSFLARVTPAGQEGQIFGLYATTGRAVSFLTPTLWSLFIAIGGAQYWGILGIMVVLAIGLVLMILVKLPTHVR
ncbi:MFS transporter [Pontimonas salivibrio]|uniref:MFS transporter n=1 Tax=Pontimonas salivibrio TaxID=1159327 RepID=A0A2L2BN76_9MICO|nr:MFS transporter [Pontimonas salivibrio]AVG23114.1 MFS transporter [Pontimonas salivibrio]